MRGEPHHQKRLEVFLEEKKTKGLGETRRWGRPLVIILISFN